MREKLSTIHYSLSIKQWMVCLCAAAALTGCVQSEVEDTLDKARLDVRLNERMPVGFGTYLGTQAETRAAINSKEDLATAGGFGVFGYYTDAVADDSKYDRTNSEINYMYNQPVTSSDGTSWTYTPIKYWPNETKDDSQATGISTYIDRLSFLAYAPWVDNADFAAGSIKGSPSSGITLMTGNTGKGDAKITYTLPTDGKLILSNAASGSPQDLMYGVAGGTSGFSYTAVNGTPISIPAGQPFINLVKPSVSEKMKFYFKHALAGIKLYVQGVFDEVTPDATNPNKITDATYIKVESVSITMESIPKQGVLNLYPKQSGTDWVANWAINDDASNKANYTLEGIAANIAANLKYSNTETPASVKGGVGRTSLTDNTATTKKQVLLEDASGNQPIYMIVPVENAAGSQKIVVNIVYRVYTVDARLKEGWSVIKNDITKTITMDKNLMGGQILGINLMLGMTSAKFEATVTDWNSDEEANVNLPKNN